MDVPIVIMAHRCGYQKGFVKMFYGTKKGMRLLGARSHVDTKEEGKKYIEKARIEYSGD